MGKYCRLTEISSFFSYFLRNWKSFIFILLLVTISVSGDPEQENDSSSVGDKLIEMAYYTGKPIERIKYDEIKSFSEKSVSLKDIQIESDRVKFIEQKIEKHYKNELKITDSLINNTHDFKNNNKSEFTRSIYELYGNKTIFQISLEDLEGMVNKSMLTDGQAIIFWESLIQLKSDRVKILKKKNVMIQDNEYYAFNVLPVKALSAMAVSLILFFTLYNLSAFFSKSKIILFIFHLICVLLIYLLADYFYRNSYYFSSSILFLELVFNLKSLLDTIFVLFGYEKIDIDILDRTQETKDIHFFTIKLTIISFLLIIMHVLVFRKFSFFLNYLYFYVTVTQGVYLVCKFSEKSVNLYFQPFKKFVLFSVGIINFLLSKFHRLLVRFPNSNELKNDSFYIISDLFSFICMAYLYDFLFAQTNNFAHLFCEKKDEFKNDLSEKIQNILLENKSHSREITINDFIWVLPLLIGSLFLFVGLYFNNFITFYFSFYFFKMIMKVFGQQYKVKIMRITYIALFIFLIIANHHMYSKSDNVLFELLFISNTQIVEVLKVFGKVLGLVFILTMIFVNYQFIFVMNKQKDQEDGNDEISSDQFVKKVEITTSFERKKKKKFKTIEVHVVQEEKVKFTFWNLVYMNFDLFLNYALISMIYFYLVDQEKNYFVILFYCFLLAILILRIFFIVNEFKNDYEYLFAYLISFFIAIRLVTISNGYPLIYFVSCTYLLILIISYCIIDRRKLIITIIILFHLFSACLYLDSYYFFILICLMVMLPFSVGSEEKKFSCTFCGVFIPVSVILIFQLIGFKKIVPRMIYVKELVNTFAMFDVFEVTQNFLQSSSYLNEFSFNEKLNEFLFRI